MSQSDSPDKDCITLGNGECVSENCMHTQPEPTLTCSEVVERLAHECHEVRRGGAAIYFNVAKAEAILHSWRERRVQELEEALRRIRQSLDKAFLSSQVKFIAQYMTEATAEAERALAKSEWREQIRKGAK